MGAACHRRAANPTPVQKPTPKPQVTRTPKPSPSTTSVRATTSSKIDYSKWDNLIDSDDEKEETPKEETQKVSMVPNEEAYFTDTAGHSLSRWSGKGLEMMDEFKALCARARNDLKYELKQELSDVASAPKPAKLPADHKQPVGIISVGQLSRYNNTNDRNLVSIYGDIFDVSSRPDLYGYGKYAFQSGKDITWLIVVGKEDPGKCNKFYDILKLDTEKLPRFLHLICQHLVAFESDYGKPVGQLLDYRNDNALPRPPIENEDIQECKQQ